MIKHCNIAAGVQLFIRPHGELTEEIINSVKQLFNEDISIYKTRMLKAEGFNELYYEVKNERQSETIHFDLGEPLSVIKFAAYTGRVVIFGESLYFTSTR